MTWRKCLVRGLVFTVLAGLAGAGWVYQSWTCPAAVRQQVVDRLEGQLPAAAIRLESAGLRLLGGISFCDLRLIRRDDPAEADLLHVPSGIIYHDKERLTEGKLEARKIELHRPKLHVVREPDGRWNLAGLLGEVRPDEPIPTVVVDHGTLLIEDRLAAPERLPFEIRDVSLTLINDPLPVLKFAGQGTADLAGRVCIEGSFQRESMAFTLTVTASQVAVGPPLAQEVGGYCSALADHARQLSGTADMRLLVDYQPGRAKPWGHLLCARLHDGKLRHPKLPLPLDQIEGELECNGTRVEIRNLTARSGPATVTFDGWVQDRLTDACNASASGQCCADWPPETADLHGMLTVKDLHADADLVARLPEAFQTLAREYDPVGVVHLNAAFDRKSGKWYRHCVLCAADVSAYYVKFKYRLGHIQGTIEQTIDPDRAEDVRKVDLVGQADGRPVHIRGQITGCKAPAVDIDVWGEAVPYSERVRAALPPRFRKLAESFNPAGRGNFIARIRRAEGQETFHNHFHIDFFDGTVRYDVFPYPLENVRGTLDIYPDRWEFRDFKGSHKGCAVRGWGQSRPGPAGEGVSLVLEADHLLMDEELEGALTPRLQGVKAAWGQFVPSGRIQVRAQVEQSGADPEDQQITVAGRGCSLCPHFFPYRLDDMDAAVRYQRGRVDIERFAARHGPTVVTLGPSEVHIKPAGGFWAKLSGLRVDPLVADAAFLGALPGSLQKICEAVELKTPVAVQGDAVIDQGAESGSPAVIYWDGGVTLQGAAFHAGVPLEKVNGQVWCRGRHDGRQLEGLAGNVVFSEATVFHQPIQEIHTSFEVSRDAPYMLRLPDFQARLFGGNVGGEARVEFAPGLRYDVHLTALGVKLEEFGRYNFGPKVQYSGLATARLYLSGDGPEVRGLEGRGSVEVPDGRLYNLPILLDLLKVLGLKPPDRTAFEEAYAHFTIHGPRVAISRLDLFGNAISLSGQGEMNLDGTDLQLDFYAIWGRIMQMLPPLLRPLPPAISQHLLRIEMRGQVDNVHCTKEPVPILVDHLDKFLRRMAGRGLKGQESGARNQGTVGAQELGRNW